MAGSKAASLKGLSSAAEAKDKKAEKENVGETDFYSNLRYNIVPPVFLVFFTLVTQVLVSLGGFDDGIGLSTLLAFFTGLFSTFAWKVVLVFYAWCFFSLKIPNTKVFKGPPTPKAGYVPVYAANGTQFYLASLAAFLALAFVFPDLPVHIYQDFSSIVAVLNATALILCWYLLVKGQTAPEAAADNAATGQFPLPYLFYRGIELHPRLLGVDIKQWTNCRVGMMGWALLVVNFCLAGIRIHGFSAASTGQIVNAVLINIYLFKFFFWETGYFNTLDITLDRAGYYLCWGCMVWVQVFYTFSAYYMVHHQPKTSVAESMAILVFGILAILFNYVTDRQKELFRATGGKCHIWGRPAKFLEVKYTNHDGNVKKSRLMLSGFWGVARHMNYVFEILLSLSWSLPAAHYGITPFLYFFFTIILLVHRTFRDEEKCSAKYGDGWTKYCQAVPYRFIPYVF